MICIFLLVHDADTVSNVLKNLEKDLWAAHEAAANSLRKMQGSQPMMQGSFYLLRRKCGKPNCRCMRGKLHGTWVLTRSEKGKDRLYIVPKHQQVNVRKWASEYRQWQRERAALAKRCAEMLALVDQMAEQRLLAWPGKKELRRR